MFGARATLRRLRVFKVLYYLTSLFMWRDTLRHRREVRALGAVDEQHRVPTPEHGRAAHRISAAGTRASRCPPTCCSPCNSAYGNAPVPARCARVRLEPLAGAGLTEVWYANGPVHTGFDGQIRFAADDHHLAAAIEVDEREHGGLAGAAAYVYSHIAQFQLTSRYRHLQRIWNYLDDINQGEGDQERYRVFCSGRAEGLKLLGLERFPAATAIGRRDGSHACRCTGSPAVSQASRWRIRARPPRICIRGSTAPRRQCSHAPCWWRRIC